jgi:heat shock protein HspQ
MRDHALFWRIGGALNGAESVMEYTTDSIQTRHAKYGVGELVHHRLFNYRGVVVDIDPVFMRSDEWYERVARSLPPKDQPWYRVLVHNTTGETYVAERNLTHDMALDSVEHPLIKAFFCAFEGGRYITGQPTN